MATSSLGENIEHVPKKTAKTVQQGSKMQKIKNDAV